MLSGKTGRSIQRRKRKGLRSHVLALQNRLDLLHHLGMLRRDVFRLGGIGFQVVEFQGQVGLHVFLFQIGADRLPAVAEPEGLLASVAGEFAVEERTLLLLLAEQGRHQADAVDAGGDGVLFADEFEEGGQPVLEPGDAVAGGAGRDLSGPACDLGDADAALVEFALEPAQLADAVEEGHVDLLKQVGGAVVGTEDDEGVFAEAEFVDEGDDLADLLVEL